MCCGGAELKCGISGMTIQRNSGQRFVMVVEAMQGASVSVTVTGN
jgi:hypothetical protein